MSIEEHVLHGARMYQHFWTELERSGVPSSLFGFLRQGEVEKVAERQMDPKDETGDLSPEGGMDVERLSPVQEIVGVRVETHPDGARGIPVIKPPPGYLYDPVLRALTPNLQDPGWVGEEEAMLQRTNAVGQDAQHQGELAEQPQPGQAPGAPQPQAAAPGAPQPGAPQPPGAPKTPQAVSGQLPSKPKAG